MKELEAGEQEVVLEAVVVAVDCRPQVWFSVSLQAEGSN